MIFIKNFMKKEKKNFFVTDLDDTIWDWLNMWYKSFEPYIERISREFEIDMGELKASFKKLHQKYGTTEASFIYEEIDALSSENKKMFNQANAGLRSIIHEYNSNKKNNLFLYDGVMSTLSEIKKAGTKIVGFTESNSYFTKYRIRHLNLDGVFDWIYAPVDPGVPASVIKYYNEGYWEPKVTEFRYLAADMRKPNPQILETIIKDFNADKSQTVYVGDKLDRDISMARDVHVSSVWAKYGWKIDVKEYGLLRDVTHWTQEDVEREKKFKEQFHEMPKPDYTLNFFGELLEYFEFTDFKTT